MGENLLRKLRESKEKLNSEKNYSEEEDDPYKRFSNESKEDYEDRMEGWNSYGENAYQ